KLIIVSKLSPGDVLMLTAAIRDLHRSHPGKFLTAVDTSVPELWENNPYVVPLAEIGEGAERMEANYPIIHESNGGAYHFVHGYRLDLEKQLGLRIRQGPCQG